jgi:hypothetical protein
VHNIHASEKEASIEKWEFDMPKNRANLDARIRRDHTWTVPESIEAAA